MFGTTAPCVGGKVFMFPWRGTLVVRSRRRRPTSSSPPHAERLAPGHGRTSPTWAAIFASASDQWPRLAQEARAFAEG